MSQELLFFDNNFYRYLCTSKDGSTFQKWVASLSKNEPLKRIFLGNPLEPYVTPFSILEALGITIPYQEIKLPQYLRQGSYNGFDEFHYVNSEAKKYFESLDILKIEYLNKRFSEQSIYTHPLAKSIERMHLAHSLQDVNVTNKLITALSFDYIMKYQYSREYRKGLRSFLFVHWLFIQNSLLSSLSKYRLTKSIWEDAYEDMQRNPLSKIEKADEINKLISLKKYKDLSDTDLIHLAIHGYYSKNTYRRIICITCDNYETILFRVRMYKTLYKACLDFVKDSSDVYQKYKNILNQFANGLILICNNNCEVIHIITVNEIPAFT